MEPDCASIASSPSHREVIHDLRNLFGVVAAARYLLAKRPAEDKRTFLLEALEGAALRGREMTSELLAQHTSGQVQIVDLNGRIRDLEPMIRTILAGEVALDLDLRGACLPVRVDQAGLDAAILELVVNARAAVPASGRIRIRTHFMGGRAWVSIADNGRGMSPAMLDRTIHGKGVAGVHGTGLSRVRNFLKAAQGRFHIRSREGGGTVVCMTLPMVHIAAFGGVVGTSGPTSIAGPPPDKESTNEDRQSATA